MFLYPLIHGIGKYDYVFFLVWWMAGIGISWNDGWFWWIFSNFIFPIAPAVEIMKYILS